MNEIEKYENIVRDWYIKLQPRYLGCLMNRYPQMRLEDARNLYQDTFIAVQRNLHEGRVRENTSWGSYIIQIGLNMASKFMRHAGITDSMDCSEKNNVDEYILSRRIDGILKNMPKEDVSIYDDPEALRILGDEIAHTPEPCNSIIRLFYFDRKKMDDIAEIIGYNNANTAKVKKSQCMKDFVRRAKKVFRFAGFNI